MGAAQFNRPPRTAERHGFSPPFTRMIFFGEAPLRKALAEFAMHYHKERNHQGLENQLIDPDGDVGHTTGRIQCRERLGGLLRYYHRRAA